MSTTLLKDFKFNKKNNIKFIIDTNVLYYVNSGYFDNTDYYCKHYSNFIGDILSNNIPIYVSTLNLQELIHIVENKEYEIYLDNNKLDKKTFSKKDFRKDKIERMGVQNKIETIMAELLVYEFLDSSVNLSQIQDCVTNFNNHNYDIIDYIMVDGLKNNDTYFLTNDTDFQFDNNIKVVSLIKKKI